MNRGRGLGYVGHGAKGNSYPLPCAPPAPSYPQSRAPPAPSAGGRGCSRPAKRPASGGDEEDDSYFDDDDDEPDNPAPADDDEDPLDAFMRENGQPSAPKQPRAQAPPPPLQEEEEDPLDAYMAGLSRETKAAAPAAGSRGPPAARPQQCDEEEDHVASFMEEQEREMDEEAAEDAVEGAPRRQLKEQKGKQKQKQLDLLAPVDHSAIAYAPIRTNFYSEHPSVTAMSDAALGDVRRRLNVKCSGFDVPRPIRRFEEVPAHPMRGTRSSGPGIL